MSTKIIFNTDKKLKEAAQKRAREQGITLSTMLNLATRAYVERAFTVDIVELDISRARNTKSTTAKDVRRRLGFPA